MEEINKILIEGTDGLCDLLVAYMNGEGVIREMIEQING